MIKDIEQINHHLRMDCAEPTWQDKAVAWRNRALLLLDHLPMPVAACEPDGTILFVNPAMASEWSALPGQLAGRNALDLFRPVLAEDLRSIVDAIRLGRRSRYPISVSWTTPAGAERCGELTVDLISETSADHPHLLLLLRVAAEPAEPAAAPPGPRVSVSPVEARVLALAAGGATTAQIARAVELTVDGVNYHLGRLSRRWGVANRAALVARAYVHGVLAPGVWPPEPA
ncbi:LuxR C-terminal-related transcriptional regulator [Goodfellowiella coeruleoviolacea]|uniref:DNA-binding transcriptional regulator, CsgD family n=1 Tax=Goodfellowiella coeruleoviolacea TaxID=334858 RepID=A0AAE3GGA8_9PSEU|nr:LuxR C-terminal-related transcriptional regulator [Goodfellowiella coeruleoviolacea]MCP2165613.1 DNA-binding transcriptional regulator, CsgD family [Goodfellowiella coeruleoviolacea]